MDPCSPTGNSTAILVVDDNPQNRLLVRMTLEEENHRVVEAASGEAGLEIFSRGGIGCVLLDYRMPAMSGAEACRRLRALPGGGSVPVLFLTALRTPEAFDEAQRAGADDFVTKPVEPSDLVRRVQTALRLSHLSGELRDSVASLKSQRDALQRLRLEKEALVSFIVHDLKNPVNGLDLEAQVLLREATISESTRGAVLRMRAQARAMLRLIHNLLDVGRADAGGLRAQLQPVEVAPLLVAAKESLEGKARHQGVEIVVEADSEVTQADPILLGRTLENLLDNGLRYSPRGSKLFLRARRRGPSLELRVEDAGPGVPAHQRERLFEPYVQLDARGQRGAGQGLGLAFCKRAVAALGGQLWVEEAVSGGAAFCIRLNSSDAQRRSLRRLRRGGGAGGGAKRKAGAAVHHGGPAP